ncbi:MAG: hypothetical protein IT221_13505 [Fluviicola sp.]|nr:hypothetical protein [Fluviicola sp.]
MAEFKVTVNIPKGCSLDYLSVNNENITDFKKENNFHSPLLETYNLECVGKREGLNRVTITIEINGKKQTEIILPVDPNMAIIDFNENITPEL